MLNQSLTTPFLRAILPKQYLHDRATLKPEHPVHR